MGLSIKGSELVFPTVTRDFSFLYNPGTIVLTYRTREKVRG